MSCSCSNPGSPASVCSPCGFNGVPDPANESLASAVSNFTTQFFGTITKTLVDGAVTWTLPCNLDAGLEGNPRLAGEGLACYFLRLLEDGSASVQGGVLVLPELTETPEPAAGYGKLYVEQGALYYIAPSGAVTELASA